MATSLLCRQAEQGRGPPSPLGTRRTLTKRLSSTGTSSGGGTSSTPGRGGHNKRGCASDSSTDDWIGSDSDTPTRSKRGSGKAGTGNKGRLGGATTSSSASDKVAAKRRAAQHIRMRKVQQVVTLEGSVGGLDEQVQAQLQRLQEMRLRREQLLQRNTQLRQLVGVLRQQQTPDAGGSEAAPPAGGGARAAEAGRGSGPEPGPGPQPPALTPAQCGAAAPSTRQVAALDLAPPSMPALHQQYQQQQPPGGVAGRCSQVLPGFPLDSRSDAATAQLLAAQLSGAFSGPGLVSGLMDDDTLAAIFALATAPAPGAAPLVQPPGGQATLAFPGLPHLPQLQALQHQGSLTRLAASDGGTHPSPGPCAPPQRRRSRCSADTFSPHSGATQSQGCVLDDDDHDGDASPPQLKRRSCSFDAPSASCCAPDLAAPSGGARPGPAAADGVAAAAAAPGCRPTGAAAAACGEDGVPLGGCSAAARSFSSSWPSGSGSGGSSSALVRPAAGCLGSGVWRCGSSSSLPPAASCESVALLPPAHPPAPGLDPSWPPPAHGCASHAPARPPPPPPSACLAPPLGGGAGACGLTEALAAQCVEQDLEEGLDHGFSAQLLLQVMQQEAAAQAAAGGGGCGGGLGLVGADDTLGMQAGQVAVLQDEAGAVAGGGYGGGGAPAWGALGAGGGPWLGAAQGAVPATPPTYCWAPAAACT